MCILRQTVDMTRAGSVNSEHEVETQPGEEQHIQFILKICTCHTV